MVKEKKIFVEVSKNSHLDYFDIPQSTRQRGQILEIDVMDNSVLRYFALVPSGNFSSALRINLLGTGAEAHLYCMVYGARRDNVEIKHSVVHKAPSTVSQIVVAAALDGKSRMSYDGLIRVESLQASCKGRQEAKFLLLSKDAVALTAPNLDIYNDDVRCSHSVSITRVDILKKFYLQSRGIDEARAQEQIVCGHFFPIYSLLPAKVKIKIDSMLNFIC